MSGDLEGHASIPRAIQRDPDVTWMEKLVYLALSSRANSKMRCWPSISTIAKESSMSEASVKRALKKLAERDLISWTPDPAGAPGQTVNIYTLGGSTGGHTERGSQGAGVTGSPRGGQPDPLTIEVNDGKDSPLPLIDEPSPEVVKFTKGLALEASFEEFWTSYPRTRRTGKKAVRAKYLTAVKNGADPAAILAGLRAYLALWKKKYGANEEFVPLAMTWVNRAQWEDEIEVAPAEQPIEKVYGFTEHQPYREPNWELA